MANLQKQQEYFEVHKDELLEKYDGKAILITESLEVYPFASLEEGYRFGVEKYGYGNFMLTECQRKGDEVQIVSPIITVL